MKVQTSLAQQIGQIRALGSAIGVVHEKIRTDERTKDSLDPEHDFPADQQFQLLKKLENSRFADVKELALLCQSLQEVNQRQLDQLTEIVRSLDLKQEDSTLRSPLPIKATYMKPSCPTPATPMMDSFSASFASSLSPTSGRKSGKSRGSRRSNPANYHPHMDAFQDEDDMITLETESTKPTTRSKSKVLAPTIAEEMDERQYSPSTHQKSVSRATLDVESTEQSDYDSFTCEESTNVMPTVVAEQEDNAIGHAFRPISRPGNPVGLELDRKGFPGSRPQHIFFDQGAPSPAHTNLTMDNTMLHDTTHFDTLASHQDDNISTATPVLDRYRLIEDDCSVGIRVVPNVRRSHQKIRHRRSSLPRPSDEHRASMGLGSTTKGTPLQTFATPSARSRFSSLARPAGISTPMTVPAKLPGFVSARKKPYRKTPHPKKTSTIEEENQHPNDSSFRGTIFDRDVASQSIDFSVDSSSSIPMFGNRVSSPVRSHLTQHRGRPRAQSASATEERMLRIKEIQEEEYDEAPHIVRTQVDLATVNESIRLLNNSAQPKQHMAARDLYELLDPLCGSSRNSKKVLMSLCHWRRLVMLRESESGMMFSVARDENIH